MLTTIKSFYFIQNCFFNLDEKKKLKLVKYNKCLQNINGINLFNYKLFSKRYIVFEEKGKGKEYNSSFGNLLFEGEYLNRERNGKGKEYDYYTYKLKFEGNYLKGLRNGKGKEYDFNGNIIFEGEYKYGKQWSGKGYENKKLIYILYDGKGYINSKYFEGEYLNGERNGKGKEYNNYLTLIFDGEYRNGKRWNGKLYDELHNTYELINGKGYIKYYCENGYLMYEAEYNNGEKNGKGKEYDKNGDLEFEGEYINGEKNGKGKEYCCENVLFEGEYLHGEKRKGKEYNYNGNLEFEGEYLFGIKYNGIGYDRYGNIITKINNGNVIFEVEYLDGENNG